MNWILWLVVYCILLSKCVGLCTECMNTDGMSSGKFRYTVNPSHIRKIFHLKSSLFYHCRDNWEAFSCLSMPYTMYYKICHSFTLPKFYSLSMILDGSSSSFTVYLTDMTEEIYPNFGPIKWTLVTGKYNVVPVYSTQLYPGIFFNTKSVGTHSMRKEEDCHWLLHQKRVHSLTAGKLENAHSLFY